MSAIKADGGGDAPEDIMGGLKAVFTNITWRTGATKVSSHGCITMEAESFPQDMLTWSISICSRKGCTVYYITRDTHTQ